MTIPEHIREEAIIHESILNDAEKIAAAIGLGSDPWDGLSATIAIATALLAAERRGMERAAELAAKTVREFPLSHSEYSSGYEDAGDAIAAAIRTAREERG